MPKNPVYIMTPKEGQTTNHSDFDTEFETHVFPHISPSLDKVFDIRQAYQHDTMLFNEPLNPKTGLTQTEGDALLRIAKSIDYLPAIEQELTWKAIGFSLEKHVIQKRKSGDPYSIHPLWLIERGAELHLPGDMLATLALHDVKEDCGVTTEEITEKFSPEISHLVDGMTKIRSRHLRTTGVDELTKVRQVLSIHESPKLNIMKILDRVHNMLTIGFLPLEKQRYIARETREIYLPLSRYLGMLSEADILDLTTELILHPEQRKKIESYTNLSESLRKSPNPPIPADMLSALTSSYDYQISIPSAVTMARANRPFVVLDIGIESNEYDWIGEAETLLQHYKELGYEIHMKSFSAFSRLAHLEHPLLRTYTLDIHVPGMNTQDGSPLYTRIHISSLRQFNMDQHSAIDAVRYPFSQENPDEFRRKKQLGFQRWFSLVDRLHHQPKTSGELLTVRDKIDQLAWRVSVGWICVIGDPQENDKNEKQPWYLSEGSSVMDYAADIAPSGWPYVVSAQINGGDVPLGKLLRPFDTVTVQFGKEQNWKNFSEEMFTRTIEAAKRVSRKRKQFVEKGVLTDTQTDNRFL